MICYTRDRDPIVGPPSRRDYNSRQVQSTLTKLFRSAHLKVLAKKYEHPNAQTYNTAAHGARA
jgi:hypothetical protein